MAEYDAITAAHYAAWRPPLHHLILAKALATGKHFEHGLDIGCGTGQSTHALADYCEKVVGIDPSPEMIALAQDNDRVRFLAQTKNNGEIDQGFLDGGFDVITFAGSLHYQKPEVALEEISWLASEPATIIVYDFNVLLEPVFTGLQVELRPGDYNHAKNFGSDTRYDLKRGRQLREVVSFGATPEEVGHLLFSVKGWREDVFSGLSYAAIVRQLSSALGRRVRLKAEIFLTRYGMP